MSRTKNFGIGVAVSFLIVLVAVPLISRSRSLDPTGRFLVFDETEEQCQDKGCTLVQLKSQLGTPDETLTPKEFARIEYPMDVIFGRKGDTWDHLVRYTYSVPANMMFWTDWWTVSDYWAVDSAGRVVGLSQMLQ